MDCDAAAVHRGPRLPGTELHRFSAPLNPVDDRVRVRLSDSESAHHSTRTIPRRRSCACQWSSQRGAARRMMAAMRARRKSATEAFSCCLKRSATKSRDHWTAHKGHSRLSGTLTVRTSAVSRKSVPKRTSEARYRVLQIRRQEYLRGDRTNRRHGAGPYYPYTCAGPSTFGMGG